MSKYAPAIQGDNPELSRRQIEGVLSSYHAELRKALALGDRAYIHGVCSLKVKPVAPRVINLPHMKGEKSRAKARLAATPSTQIDHILYPDSE